MFSKLRSLFTAPDPGPQTPPEPVASVPAGQRVYAIGDIHGRLDLFEQLLQRIKADDAARPSAETTLILLGDLVDRGPDSRGVVSRAMELVAGGSVRVLAGNHEEMMLGSLSSEETLRHFLRHGGRETLFSYGLQPDDYRRSKIEELQQRMAALVPAEHVEFLQSLEDRIVIGDYAFVHAGVRPGVALDAQSLSDLRWIRREFLDHPGPHGHVIVHGHTIVPDPVVLPGRIGIDTGAFASGKLTALGMEGSERWFLSAFIAPETDEAL